MLDLVHTDVCGPMDVASIGGSQYFLTFIDNASQKVWIYFMHSKVQVFSIFQTFLPMVERETGKKLK